MTTLPRLQSQFQKYLQRLEGDAENLIADNTRVDARTRLSIYAEAYRLRLLEALDANYPVLHQWQGDEVFETLGGAYIDVCPSSHYNIRYVGDQLPRFLAVVEPFCNTPAVSEMAALEWALALAFDAADSPVITTDAVAAIPAARWPDIRFRFHPAVQRLDLYSNVPAIWKAIHAQTTPPDPQSEPGPVGWLVWRQKLSPYFRSLSVDETWALDTAQRGDNFAALCEGLCEWIDAQNVATHAAALLQQWISDELVTAVFKSGE